jgi:hypothetical protein
MYLKAKLRSAKQLCRQTQIALSSYYAMVPVLVDARLMQKM